MEKRIGILGGTFNPIHNGHLALAWQAWNDFKLDKVLIMPSKNPPHKDKNSIIADETRCKFIELAIKDKKDIFELSKFELLRDGITYTSDTLNLLCKKYPDTKFYFIMGADSILAIEQWHQPQTIFKLADIIVAVRDDVSIEKLSTYSQYLKDKYYANIYITRMPNIEISSRSIRNSLKETGICNPYFIPKEVYNFLITNSIY